jgi:CheY-like chemotaxis protein
VCNIEHQAYSIHGISFVGPPDTAQAVPPHLVLLEGAYGCSQQAMISTPDDELQLGKVPDARTKVLIADDTQLMRRMICRLLREHSEIKIVGEAADYPQTVHMANAFRPEIILMDLHLACQPGIAPLDVRTQLNHGSRLVAISLTNDEEAEALAESFGAVKLLDKMTLFDELIPTILAVR